MPFLDQDIGRYQEILAAAGPNHRRIVTHTDNDAASPPAFGANQAADLLDQLVFPYLSGAFQTWYPFVYGVLIDHMTSACLLSTLFHETSDLPHCD